eukprot:11064452-Lingulodinium_polyedra.AAC.1
MQIYKVLRERKFQLTKEVATLFKKIHERVFGSQVVEDGFNDQKNNSPRRNRQSSLQDVFHALIGQQTASKKHHHKEV